MRNDTHFKRNKQGKNTDWNDIAETSVRNCLCAAFSARRERTPAKERALQGFAPQILAEQFIHFIRELL
jgi:hypothetical protein